MLVNATKKTDIVRIITCQAFFVCSVCVDVAVVFCMCINWSFWVERSKMYVDELFLMRKWIDNKLCEHEQSVDNVMVQKLTILDSITKRSIQKMHATMDERDSFTWMSIIFFGMSKKVVHHTHLHSKALVSLFSCTFLPIENHLRKRSTCNLFTHMRILVMTIVWYVILCN